MIICMFLITVFFFRNYSQSDYVCCWGQIRISISLDKNKKIIDSILLKPYSSAFWYKENRNIICSEVSRYSWLQDATSMLRRAPEPTIYLCNSQVELATL